MPRTPRGAITLTEEEPRTPRHRRIVAGLVVVVLAVTVTAAVLGVRHLRTLASGEQCLVTASGSTFSWAPDQAGNAAAITAIAVQRGMPPRAATIAIATAMQESKVRNVKFGDRDSLGLFQQRPSQGWGTAEQILDPEYSTNKFYDALAKVKGYQSMDIAQAAQKVQRSAAGEAYAQHEAQARVTASALVGADPRRHGVRAGGPRDARRPRRGRGAGREGLRRLGRRGHGHGDGQGRQRRPGLGDRLVGRRARRRHRGDPGRRR